MSLKQAAFLTSRVISLCFFYEAFTSFAQLPSVYVSLSMARSLRGNPEWSGLSRGLFASTGATITHAILGGSVGLALGIIFYRFGPRVTRFLTGAEEGVVVGSAPVKKERATATNWARRSWMCSLWGG